MHLKNQLADIKKHISLKNTTLTGDIVLVATPQGFFYAIVLDISPDYKKDWYAVNFTALVLPPVTVTWKLRDPQMCGEIFTINGEEHFMQAVKFDIFGLKNSACEDSTAELTPHCTDKVVPFIPRK
jgi:hypothetical protein